MHERRHQASWVLSSHVGSSLDKRAWLEWDLCTQSTTKLNRRERERNLSSLKKESSMKYWMWAAYSEKHSMMNTQLKIQLSRRLQSKAHEKALLMTPQATAITTQCFELPIEGARKILWSIFYNSLEKPMMLLLLELEKNISYGKSTGCVKLTVRWWKLACIQISRISNSIPNWMKNLWKNDRFCATFLNMWNPLNFTKPGLYCTHNFSWEFHPVVGNNADE